MFRFKFKLEDGDFTVCSCHIGSRYGSSFGFIGRMTNKNLRSSIIPPFPFISWILPSILATKDCVPVQIKPEDGDFTVYPCHIGSRSGSNSIDNRKMLLTIYFDVLIFGLDYLSH